MKLQHKTVSKMGFKNTVTLNRDDQHDEPKTSESTTLIEIVRRRRKYTSCFPLVLWLFTVLPLRTVQALSLIHIQMCIRDRLIVPQLFGNAAVIHSAKIFPQIQPILGDPGEYTHNIQFLPCICFSSCLLYTSRCV